MKTISGRNARIICNNRKWISDKFPILALVENDVGCEIAIPYDKHLKCEKSQHFLGEDLSLIE